MLFLGNIKKILEIISENKIFFEVELLGCFFIA